MKRKTRELVLLVAGYLPWIVGPAESERLLPVAVQVLDQPLQL